MIFWRELNLKMTWFSGDYWTWKWFDYHARIELVNDLINFEQASDSKKEKSFDFVTQVMVFRNESECHTWLVLCMKFIFMKYDDLLYDISLRNAWSLMIDRCMQWDVLHKVELLWGSKQDWSFVRCQARLRFCEVPNSIWLLMFGISYLG